MAGCNISEDTRMNNRTVENYEGKKRKEKKGANKKKQGTD